MKTSLNIDDNVFEAARKESLRTGKSISETISHWARVDRRTLRSQKKEIIHVAPVDLGGPAKIDIDSRRDWIDLL